MKNRLILIFVFLFGFFLRVYHINTYPPLLWDEAALGYNSYSVLKTGRDEFGQFLPLIFKSFGDYKPGLYIYLSLPFIKLLGLSVFSIRILGVFAGLGSCWLLYLVVKHFQPSVALPATTIALFSPWAIHFSRGAWESNLATFLLLLSLYLYFQKRYLFASFFLGVNLYAYQSSKFFCLFFLLFFIAQNFKSWSSVFKLSLPFLVLSLPLLHGLLFKNDTNRLKVLSLFNYPQSPLAIQQITEETGPFFQSIFFNRTAYFMGEVFRRYLNHFSPKFLFWQGDWQNPRHSAPYVGLFLWPIIFLLPVGLFYSSKMHNRTLFVLMISWLLIAPLPASLTRDEIQANRTIGLFIPICYFSALGYSIIKTKFLKFAMIIMFFTSLVYYMDMYHSHMVKKSPDVWLSGYHEAVAMASNKNYNHIYFTNFYGQPYIYFLFFTNYDPVSYQQKNHFLASPGGDVGTVTNLDNISFGSFDFNNLKKEPNSLIILSRDELLRQSLDFKEFKAIAPLNGSSNFYAFATKH